MSITKSTIAVYVYSGSTRELMIPFDYLRRDFVVVSLGGEGKPRKVLNLGVDYKFTTKTTITITRSYRPDEGYDKIIISRVTDASKRIINFQDGSILNASELNTIQLQALHVAEEARDLTSYTLFVDNEGNLDARERRIINLGTPLKDRDAVTKQYVDTASNSVIDSRDKALEYRNEAERYKNEAETAKRLAEEAKTRAAKAEVNAKSSEVKAKESEEVSTNNALEATQNAEQAKEAASQANSSKLASKISEENAARDAKRAEDAAATAVGGGLPVTGGTMIGDINFSNTSKIRYTNSKDLVVASRNTNEVTLYMDDNDVSKLSIKQTNTTGTNIISFPTNKEGVLVLDTDLTALRDDLSTIQVESVDALRRLEPTSEKQDVILKGYYPNGSIGGGLFYFDSSDKVSLDDGGTIFVTSEGNRWKRVDITKIDVTMFGAKGDGVSDDWDSISKALQYSKTVYFPYTENGYGVSKAIKPSSRSSLIFEGGKLKALNSIVGDDCVLKIHNATNVSVYNAEIDCGNFEPNCGIVIREGTNDVKLFNSKVSNARWSSVKGGGRGVIIEAHTGAPSDIRIDGVTCINVDTAIGVNGYTGARKNNILITNVLARGVNKLIALFGNGEGYPHTGDSSSCVISDVIAHSVKQPIRFDRGSNTLISNVRVYNKEPSSKIEAIIQGMCNNVTVRNLTVECPSTTYVYNAFVWKDNGSTPEYTYNSIGNSFDVKLIGTVNRYILATGYSGKRVERCDFNVVVDSISTNDVCSPQMSAYTDSYLSLNVTSLNTRMQGFISKLFSLKANAYADKDFKPEASLGGVYITSTFINPNINNVVSLGAKNNRYKTVYIHGGGISLLAPNGQEYNINVTSAGELRATKVV